VYLFFIFQKLNLGKSFKKEKKLKRRPRNPTGKQASPKGPADSSSILHLVFSISHLSFRSLRRQRDRRPDSILGSIPPPAGQDAGTQAGRTIRLPEGWFSPSPILSSMQFSPLICFLH
jgi:hypothetical protein